MFDPFVGTGKVAFFNASNNLLLLLCEFEGKNDPGALSWKLPAAIYTIATVKKTLSKCSN